MSNSVAILNQKGGVGKTTLTLGLASAAWASGTRTLVVDLDAQANATWALGVDPSVGNLGTGDALRADKAGAAADMIVPSGWSDDVWLLPAAGDLTVRDADARVAASRRRLARALKGVTSQFDLVLIDCAPSLGLNTVNGLAAARGALLVVEPSVFGLRGVAPVLDLIEDVWSADNPSLDLVGVVLNRVPAVSSAARDRIEELKKAVGSKSVWAPSIPQRVVVNQAHHERAPIHSFGSQARDLTEIFDGLLRRVRRSLV
jgi:chromosome partitioning protein